MRRGVRFWLSTGEWILLLALGAEVALFAVIAQNFFTLGNFFEIVRLSVELGLLAIALTPVIVSGGIDLSVGSMMGLAAVLFGAAYHDWGASIVGAAVVALLAGVAGGALNATLVASLNIPPLIVTLGTLSLFRGIAEGLTRGAVNYTDFPAGFLSLGQGYLWGVVPTQLLVFVPVLVGYSVLLHRSVVGRAWYVIGFTPSGARYAGLPVGRRIATLYLLSGVIASVAAIIYVAHLGQAKSDAGSGYELDAITAVVLGGTSVFGGQASLIGTAVGSYIIAMADAGIVAAGVQGFWVRAVVGAVLLAAVIGYRLLQSPEKAAARVRLLRGKLGSVDR